MRFAWKSKSSESAAVCMAFGRVKCQGLDVEQAVWETLANGRHCRNYELVSSGTLRRLHKNVLDKHSDFKKLPAAMGSSNGRRVRG